MTQSLNIRPVTTEIRAKAGVGPEIHTFPGTQVQVIQAASPAAGSSGGGSVEPYQHQQLSPSAEWVVNHNMGRRPVATSVLTLGFREVNAEVEHVSVNQTRVRFVQPQTGYARIL